MKASWGLYWLLVDAGRHGHIGRNGGQTRLHVKERWATMNGTRATMRKAGHSCVMEGTLTRLRGPIGPAELLCWCRQSGGGAVARLRDTKQGSDRMFIGAARKKDLLVKPLAANNSSLLGKEEDHQAVEAVLKLYAAIKNKNLRELSDILGDECGCICNFIPFCRGFQGKKQVLAFFSSLIRTLGNNIEFVVQSSTQDGMSVSVTWKLEWNKKTMPLGKGFSFHICQIYQGRVVIRNVEMFMESFSHMELFRLRILGFLMSMSEKMSSYISPKRESKRAGFVALPALLSLAAVFVLLLKLIFQ
ncbi:hypothetical protein NL676_013268 [Syzygium grande]|nr:hypothetical protein NL676_013268 [Syzygium grande]